MSTTFTQNLGIIAPGIAEAATRNQWGSLWNTNAALLDSAITGELVLDVSGSANVVLTSIQGQPDQSRNVTFIFTGALTGNIDVIWPQGASRNFRVRNEATGAFTLSAAANNGSGGPAGSAFVVPNDGNFYFLASDGTDVAPYIPVGLPISGGTVTGNLTVGDGSGARFIAINGAAASFRRILYQTAGSNRWLAGANSTAESGSNVGSDYVIDNFTDAGALIGTPVTISRSTGVMSLSATLTFPTASSIDNSTKGATTAFVTTAITNLASFVALTYYPVTGGLISGNVTINNGSTTTLTIQGAAGSNRSLFFDTGSVSRWNAIANATAETGGNAGTDFQLRRFDDSGGFLGSAFTVTRSTGVVAFSATPTFPAPAFGDNSTNGVTTSLLTLTMPISAVSSGSRAGTGSLVRIARITLTPPSTGADYIVTAHVSQSFAAGATGWSLEFLFDGAVPANSITSTIAQNSVALMFSGFIGPGSGQTIDLMWSGQNANVTMNFATISAQPTN